jgi:flagellar biosynthesis repressor protein FlbT
MNRHPLHRRPNGIGEALISSPDSQITLIRRHIRTTTPDRPTLFVYQALTIIGKDCDEIGHNGISIAGPSKAGTSKPRHHLAPKTRRTVLAYTGRDNRRPVMALKVELKPNEQIIIGSCVITNTDQRARLLIDGEKIPILREKDIMTPATANTPAKLVYLAVQLMYISPDPQVNHGAYFNLVRDIVTAAPSAWPVIEGINNNILSGDLYQALKEARKLIAYEKKLLDRNEANEAMQAKHAAA